MPDHRTQRAVRACGFSCTTVPHPGYWRYLGVLRRLMRLLRSKRPDIVHVDLPDAPLLGLLAGKLGSTAHLVIQRPSSPMRPIQGAVYRLVLNLTAHRITLIPDGRPLDDPQAFYDAQ